MSRALLALAAALALATAGRAEPVYFDFTAPYADVASGSSLGATGLFAGMPMNGRVMYETTGSVTSRVGGSVAFSATGSITLWAGDQTFTSGPNAPLAGESTYVSVPGVDGATDRFSQMTLTVRPQNPGLFPGATGPASLTVTLHPPNSVDDIMAGGRRPSDTVTLSFSSAGSAEGDLLYLQGAITEIIPFATEGAGSVPAETAPEPGSLSLAGLGAAALLARWRVMARKG